MQHSQRFLDLVEEARSHIREISLHDVKKRMDAGDNFRLLDVREESEWAKGHLPKAEHLGKGVLERDVESVVPDLNAEVVLYCGGGFRSALAAESLQKMGYTKVLSMAGGWREWKEAGYPTV